MLIVIEGGDRTGKTTLAKALAKVYGLKYHHFGPPGPDPAKEYIDFMLNLKEPTVCDRFFIGELIYGPMLRGKSNTTWMDTVTLCRLIRRMGVHFILMQPDMEVVRKRFQESEHEAVTWEQNVRAIMEFAALFHNLPLGRSRTIIQTDDNDGLLDSIAYCKKLVEDGEIHDHEASGFKGIGTVAHTSLVLVGEAVNPKTTRFGLPFDGGPAAKFLNSVLLEAQEQTRLEDFLYIANADTMTKPEVEHHRKLNSTFIALGSKAEDFLAYQVPRLEAIPHPQFWSRFKSKDRIGYVNKLKMIQMKFQEKIAKEIVCI